MAETLPTQNWRYWLLFLALVFAVIFLRLLPLDAGAGGLPGPDLPACLALAWVLRRPTFVPVLLIATVMLGTDILFMRPLGLWTAFVVLGTEFLRARGPYFREVPFLLEWMMVGIVIVVMTLGYRLVQAIFAVDQPALGLALLQMMATIAAYPAVVAFSVWVLGVRKLSPGAVDALGRKL